MLETAYITDTGHARQGNQDAMHVDKANRVFIVADGMGGRVAGDLASTMTIDCVKEHLASRLAGADNVGSLLREAVRAANRRIYERSRQSEDLAGMGSTVVVAVLKSNDLFLAHVGDSRACVFDGDVLRLVTRDHTVANQLVTEGVLTEADAALDHRRHVLTRAVGSAEDVEVDVSVSDYLGETMLLCTDGLTDMVDDTEISDVLRKETGIGDACKCMVELANEHGGVDNTTIVIFRED